MKRKIRCINLILGFIVLLSFHTAFPQTVETNPKVTEPKQCSLITEGIEFCIKTPFVSVENGKDVFITYTMKNVTDQGIKTRFGRNSRKKHFATKITNENGNKVPTILEELIEKQENKNSKEGFIINIESGRGPASFYFEPGDEFKWDLNLSKLYGFDRKGKYYVEISKNDSEQVNEKNIINLLGKVKVEIK